MQTSRAVLPHPAAFRPTRQSAAAIAAVDVTKHLGLTLAVLVAGTAALALLLTLALVAAPIGGVFIAWILWRSARGGARASRFGIRARLRARSLGLRRVRGASA